MNSVLKSVLILTLLGSVAISTGCTYTTDRLNDLTDVCQAKVVLGEGVDLSGRVLWVALGGGYSDSVSAGFGNRGYGVWQGKRIDAQVLLPYVHTEEVDPLAGNIESYGIGDRGLVESWPPAGKKHEFFRLTDEETYESYLRLGVTAQFFLGFDAEVRPVEIIDFLLGIFTIDFRNDDAQEQAIQ
jgi:hypothetical protein